MGGGNVRDDLQSRREGSDGYATRLCVTGGTGHRGDAHGATAEERPDQA